MAGLSPEYMTLDGPHSESKLVLEFKEMKTTILATNLKNVTFLYQEKSAY